MKVNIHIEADDADLRRLATELLAKTVLTTIRGVGETVGDPDFMKGLQGMFGQMFQQGIQMGHAAAAAATSGPQPIHSHGPHGPPPGAGDVGPFAAKVSPERAMLDRCVCIPAAGPTLDEGIQCCHCDAFNATQRALCRNCGHRLCHVIVPDAVIPPPSEPAAAPAQDGPANSDGTPA